MPWLPLDQVLKTFGGGLLADVRKEPTGFPNDSDADLDLMAHGLDELLRNVFNPMTRAATADEIVLVLADWCDLLGARAPGDAGIRLYEGALSDVPKGLLDEASARLARTYRYARLPLPADFLATIGGELAWVEQMRASIINQRSRVGTEITRRTR